jgi:hypothetical protein
MAPSSLRGQTVRSARVVADLTRGDGSAVVDLEYVLHGVPPSGGVHVSLLDFGQAAARDVRVEPGAMSVEVPLVHGVARGGELPVDRIAEDGVVRVRYRIPDAVREEEGELRGHIPVLTVDGPPEETSPDLFQAELRVPAGWTVSEGFPTALSAGGEGGVYRVALPVVPSVVSFRARADGAWRPGLPLLLDLTGVGVLLAFAVAGWRHLREPWT